MRTLLKKEKKGNYVGSEALLSSIKKEEPPKA